MPLDVMMDADNCFTWDIKLPDREECNNSTTSLFEGALLTLAETQQAPPPPMAAAAEEDVGGAASGGGAAASSSGGDGGSPRKVGSNLAEGLAVPVLDNPVVGQITVKRVALALKLDEERVAELLGLSGTSAAASTHNKRSPPPSSSSSAFSSGAGAVQAANAAVGIPAGAAAAGDAGLAGRLLGCFGDLFTASLDVGWKAEPDEDGSRPAKCMLTVANNDVTRVRIDALCSSCFD